MHGDFSRGHRPDRKRGKAYRRVLLQQGRTLLDSDFNALSDANEHLLRELARDAGVGDGSPDGGFRITAGPLLARFDTLQAVVAQGTDFVARLDQRYRYADRLPSLLLDARRGAGLVTLRLRRRLSTSEYPKLRIWARRPGALRVGMGGGAEQPFPGTLPAERFQAYELPVPAGVTDFDSLTLRFEDAGPDNEAWIGLIEGIPANAKDRPFWVSQGRYRVDGLAVELPEDAPYPEVSFPLAKGFTPRSLGLGVHVAYLEIWERHITHLEDPGLLELALGGTVDTCTRVETVGQVKLAKVDDTVAGRVEPEPYRTAFAEPTEPARTLRVQPRQVAFDPGNFGSGLYTGYIGAENRLYRFEIQDAGALGQATLKWSRNNGASLFRVLRVLDANATLALPSSSDVRNGDLIEVLTETVELGDGNDGRVYLDTDVRFSPPTRTVGRLYFVREKGLTGSEKLLELRDVSTRLPVALDAELAAQPGMKLRRWDGFIRTTAGATSSTLEIEDGLEVVLAGGPFRAGDYWQYEARRGHAGKPTSWEPPLNRLERLFVPLALVRRLGSDGPVQIDAWLDPDLSSAKKLWADDVLYDGTEVPTSAGTVQEALDELYARGGGDCQVTLHPGPPSGDDGVRISQAIQAKLLRGGVVCLTEGLYTLRTPVRVEGVAIELRGHGEVKVVSAVPGNAGLQVGSAGSLTLSRLTVVAGPDNGPALISLESGGDTFFAKDCRIVHAQNQLFPGIALHAPGAVADPRSKEPADTQGWNQPFAPGGPTVRLERCTVVASHGLLVNDLKGLHVQDSTFLCTRDGITTKDLGELDLQGVTFDTGLADGSLAALAYTALADYAAELARQRGSLLPFAPRATGTALYATRLGRGAVVDSLLAANMGLWVGAGANLHLARNRYFAGDTALRVDDVTSTRVEAEEIVSSGLGIHVPRAAWELLVSGCQVKANRGVLLGGEYLEAPTPAQRAAFPLPVVSLRDVRVSGNRIEGARFGVHVGPNAPGGVGSPAVELWNLDVSENTVWGTELTAVGLSGIVPPSGTTAFVLRVAHNHVEVGGTALRMRGSGIEISRNRFLASGAEALDEAAPTGAVTLLGARNVLVEGNIVQLQLEAAGICVKDSADAWVWRNTVLSPDGSRPLWVLDSRRVEIGENDFRAGECVVVRTEQLTVRGNQLAGTLLIQESSNGVVAQNRVELHTEFPLSLEHVRDRWQLSENFSAGGIRLLPAVEAGDLSTTEQVLHAQVQGNWSCDLQVGYVNPADQGNPVVKDFDIAEPHSNSAVQVIGNRADARLLVNHYDHALIAHNLTRDLLCGTAVDGKRLIGPNLLHDSGLCGDTPVPGLERYWHTATWLPAAKRLLVVGGTTSDGAVLDTAYLYDPDKDAWTATASMASRRSQHTAILLDADRVLVAGGWNGTSTLASVEIYDPGTESWTTVPVSSMSEARLQAAAVFLPESGEVLVVGGTNRNGALASAELFHPSNNTWTRIPLNAARSSPAALWVPSLRKVLVAGGLDGSTALGSAELIDPATSQSAFTGAMGIARGRASAVTLSSGKVLVAGGTEGTAALSSAELYDPGTGVWSPTGTMSTKRLDAAASLLPSGRVLLTGGSVGGTTAEATTELYEPEAGSWTPAVDLDLARQRHTATLLPTSGKVLVVGGLNGGSALFAHELLDPDHTWLPGKSMAEGRFSFTATLLMGEVMAVGGVNGTTASNSVEVYDPVKGVWRSTTGLTYARRLHTATQLGDSLLVVGGVVPGAGVPTTDHATVEAYNPYMKNWTLSRMALAAGRQGHTATQLPSGKVLIIGGSPADGSTTGSTTAELCSVVQLLKAVCTLVRQQMARPRVHHTATLLASGKVLVVGGWDGTDPSFFAELFAPDTESWSTVSKGAPPLRSEHTATLLLSGKVLVVGGRDRDTALSSAYLYDPVSQSWSPTGSLAVARFGHTEMLLRSGHVLVVGGRTGSVSGQEVTSSAELYDPSTGTWSPTKLLASPRGLHAAVSLFSGDVLVLGGVGPRGVALAKSELYAQPRVHWSTARHTMLEPRASHTATLLSTGKVLIAGGVSAPGGPFMSSVELYDFKTGSSAVTRMKTPHVEHTATLLPDGKVLVIGGYMGVGLPTMGGAELYDPGTNTWTDVGMTPGRVGHTATLLTSGKVLVVGGWDGTAGGGSSPPVLYDPRTGLWTSAGTMQQVRNKHQATLLNSGKVLVCGGFAPASSGANLVSAELYDPDNNSWTATGSMNISADMQSATLLESGKVLVLGTQITTWGAVPHAELYDPETGHWSYTGLPVVRPHHSWHAATLLPSGKVLVVQGHTPEVQVYDPLTEIWSPWEPQSMSAWRRFLPVVPLPSGELLLLGGYKASTLTDHGSVSAEVRVLTSLP